MDDLFALLVFLSGILGVLTILGAVADWLDSKYPGL